MPTELVTFSNVYNLNTASDVLEYVTDRLIRQGQPSESPTYGTCKYRQVLEGKELACGIGMIIPDAEYDSSIDSPGMSIRTMLEVGRYSAGIMLMPVDKPGIVSQEFLSLVRRVQSAEAWDEGTTVDFFSRLQAMHDAAQGLTGAKFGYTVAEKAQGLKEWLKINSPKSEEH